MGELRKCSAYTKLNISDLVISNTEPEKLKIEIDPPNVRDSIEVDLKFKSPKILLDAKKCAKILTPPIASSSINYETKGLKSIKHHIKTPKKVLGVKKHKTIDDSGNECIFNQLYKIFNAKPNH